MLPENVTAKLEIGDCWVWTGCLNHGYGQVSIDGKRWQVHRYVYTILVGPIPEGLVIDHTCRNKACANPSHLRAVSQSANVTAGLTHACGHDEWYIHPRSGKRVCHPCKKQLQSEYKARKRAANVY